MKKKLSKGAVALIVIASIILALAIVVVSLMFGWLNDFKFMTYTKARFEKAVETYRTSDVNFIAHRGLSVEEYQNTAEAFRLAASYEGTWGIETDIWATSDGKFVCMHDANAIKGISNVRNVDYATATTTPLRHNEQRYACGFEEYLEICRESGKTAVVELKDKNMTDDDIKRALDIIRESGADVTIISFHYKFLKLVRTLDAEVPMQLLINLSVPKDVAGKTQHARMDTLIAQNIDLSVNSLFLSKDMANYMHSHGRKIGVWTVNDSRNAMFFVHEFGVDYLTSDVRMKDEMDKYL